MAIRKTSRPSRIAPDRRGHIPRPPHPSWRLAAVGLTAGTAAPLASATEFWDKIGL